MLTLRYHLFQIHKCSDHGAVGYQPCPWPNCANGVPEDRFQVAPPFEGEEPEIFTRRRWTDLSGSDYYSWESSKAPNWFSVPTVFWNEARRRKLIARQESDRIYHYTTVEGFVGIIQGRQLWMSDYSYLNDTRELSHGADLVKDVAAEFLASENRPQSSELLDHWISELENPLHRVCVTSFSAERDSLSQWRAYGQIALGFEPDELTRHAYRATLRPVEYDRDRQRALVELYLHHMREAHQVDLQAGRQESIVNAYYKTDRLIELITFFKDPAFVAEREYRLAFIEHPDLMPSLGHRSSAKRFRVARGRIIPYALSDELEPVLAKDDGRALSIREVVLGPQADTVLERGVRELLDYSDMREVKLTRSDVPYRT